MQVVIISQTRNVTGVDFSCNLKRRISEVAAYYTIYCICSIVQVYLLLLRGAIVYSNVKCNIYFLFIHFPHQILRIRNLITFEFDYFLILLIGIVMF